MAAPTETLTLSLRVPLPSPGVARVALGALEPDLAPPLPGLTTPLSGLATPLPHPNRARPSPTARAQRCRETIMVQWEAGAARGLRGALCSFLELLGLVLETIESFGGAGPGQDTPPRTDHAPTATIKPHPHS